MSTQTFFTWLSNRLTLTPAIDTSTGTADAGKIIALNSEGKINTDMLPEDYGISAVLLPATENIAAGCYVNIYSNSGTLSIRRASSTTPYKAHGYTKVNVFSGSSTYVYFNGLNEYRVGLTAGLLYYLDVDGSVSSVVPVISGSIIQELGVATSATTIANSIKQPIIRA